MSTPPKFKHIVAAGPVVAVIIPPTSSITITVVIPEPLASHLRFTHQMKTAGVCKPLDFAEWIIERLADVAYGGEARG